MKRLIDTILSDPSGYNILAVTLWYWYRQVIFNQSKKNLAIWKVNRLIQAFLSMSWTRMTTCTTTRNWFTGIWVAKNNWIRYGLSMTKLSKRELKYTIKQAQKLTEEQHSVMSMVLGQPEPVEHVPNPSKSVHANPEVAVRSAPKELLVSHCHN